MLRPRRRSISVRLGEADLAALAGDVERLLLDGYELGLSPPLMDLLLGLDDEISRTAALREHAGEPAA